MMNSDDDNDDEDSLSGHGENNDLSDSHATTSGTDKNVDLVNKETRYVFYLRVGVLLVLLLAASGVCVLVWLVTSNAETNSFDSHYEATATKIIDTFMSIATEDMGAAASLVVAIVAQGQSGNQTWPFVTMTAFQERAATVMKLSGSLYIGMNPIVARNERRQWERYTNTNYSKDAQWYEDGHAYQKILGYDELDNRPQIETDDPDLNLCCGIANRIYDFDRNTSAKAFISIEESFYLPVWQTSPVTNRTMVNQNRASNSEAANATLNTSQVVFEGMQYAEPGYGSSDNPVTAEIAWLLRMANRQRTEYVGDIFTNVYFPLYDDFTPDRATVGVMRIVIHWARHFSNILPASTQGVIVVLNNTCDTPYTYKLNGGTVVPLGHGDLHDHAYDRYERTETFRNVENIEDGTAVGLKLHQNKCPYAIHVYPSATLYNQDNTNMPLTITIAVGCVFFFTVMMFFLYDRLVERRQHILLYKAEQTHKIVSSLFPKQVRDRLLEEDDEHNKKNGLVAPNQRIKSFLNGTEEHDDYNNQAPIADIFPNATVLFADIRGFTAWSSSREPSQVFILLQNVYQGFDKIAKRRKVFKIETIGDSYVAVTGVPEAQAQHAVIMARFASECLSKMTEIVHHLESSLGPDTGDLCMRFGMNSGPVTAGVLRGERSRFQLFGDTMNTASRMESTGVPGKIQATQSTVNLLIKADKGHWVTKREDNVFAKGKGVMQTYWITPCVKHGNSNGSSSTNSTTEVSSDNAGAQTSDNKSNSLLKQDRHIDWMTELLEENIRLIVAKREAQHKTCKPLTIPPRKNSEIPLDEIVEAITLLDVDDSIATVDAASIKISEELSADLRSFVATIAAAYNVDNPFHNFEHACHVTMSVSKFLKRIVNTDLEMDDLEEKSKGKVMSDKKIALHLHDYTHGIISDPITLFAVVFSALIHDVDHPGVSNTQLMQENTNLAKMFRGKSIAEQNSLEIAWNLLLSDAFQKLREYIFADNDELYRFRQVIVNVVMATDIFDRELNDLRKARWEKAFSTDLSDLDHEKNALRATIVLEHIIQASDVCHTMQHWHIYRKWNERLFCELSKAYQAGRMGVDPATFWYEGELGFLDNYIIPLANKLKECHVFGASSDECLNYALMNRAEWEVRGEELVAEMIANMKKDQAADATMIEGSASTSYMSL